MFKKIFIGLLITTLLIGGVVVSVSAYGKNQSICETEPYPLDALEMTVEELRDALRSGKTLQEIVEEKGLDYESFKEQWLAAHQTCLDEAVVNGTLTEDQAEAIQVRMEERIDEGFSFNRMMSFGSRMRSHMNFGTGRFGGGGFGPMGEILEKLGISFEQLRERLQGGESLADIAEEAGIDLSTIQTENIQAQLERIDQALADGKITEEQAERMRERLNDQLENPNSWNMFERMQGFMNRPFDNFRDGGRFGDGGFNRGRGGCW